MRRDLRPRWSRGAGRPAPQISCGRHPRRERSYRRVRRGDHCECKWRLDQGARRGGTRARRNYLNLIFRRDDIETSQGLVTRRTVTATRATRKLEGPCPGTGARSTTHLARRFEQLHTIGGLISHDAVPYDRPARAYTSPGRRAGRRNRCFCTPRVPCEDHFIQVRGAAPASAPGKRGSVFLSRRRFVPNLSNASAPKSPMEPMTRPRNSRPQSKRCSGTCEETEATRGGLRRSSFTGMPVSLAKPLVHL